MCHVEGLRTRSVRGAISWLVAAGLLVVASPVAMAFSIPTVENTSTHEGDSFSGFAPVLGPLFPGAQSEAIVQTMTIEPLAWYSDRLVGMTVGIQNASAVDPMPFSWAIYGYDPEAFEEALDGDGFQDGLAWLPVLRSGIATAPLGEHQIDIELPEYLPVASGDKLIFAFGSELSGPGMGGLYGDGVSVNSYPLGTGYFSGAFAFAPYLVNGEYVDWQLRLHVNAPEPGSLLLVALGVALAGLIARRRGAFLG